MHAKSFPVQAWRRRSINASGDDGPDGGGDGGASDGNSECDDGDGNSDDGGEGRDDDEGGDDDSAGEEDHNDGDNEGGGCNDLLTEAFIYPREPSLILPHDRPGISSSYFNSACSNPS